MIRVLADNVCQHNLLKIGKKLLLIIGFTDLYSPFYDVGRTTEDYVLHDENARYDSPNRWWRYRFVMLCRLPFKVRYRWEGSDEVFKSRPEIWIRTKRIK